MADKKFPKDMMFAARSPSVKKAWICEIEPVLDCTCKNCGGHGCMFIFLATGGPLEHNPSKGKFIDGKWWAGELFSFQCPECGKNENKVL